MDKRLFLNKLIEAVSDQRTVFLEANRDLYSARGVNERDKVDGTIITELDEVINRKLRHFAERQNVGFVGEEGDGETDRKYILNVDPLDGTDAFVAGSNVATIIATLMEMDGKFGTPILAVMYEPLTDRLWFANAGGKTYFKGRLLNERTSSGKNRTHVCAFPGDPYRLHQVFDHIGNDRNFARRQQDAIGIDAGQICCNMLDVSALSPTAAVEAPAMQLLIEGVDGVALDLEGNKLTSYEFGEVRGKPNFMLPKGGLFAATQADADRFLDVVSYINRPDR